MDNIADAERFQKVLSLPRIQRCARPGARSLFRQRTQWSEGTTCTLNAGKIRNRNHRLVPPACTKTSARNPIARNTMSVVDQSCPKWYRTAERDLANGGARW